MSDFVKAKKNLSKIVILSAYFAVWIIAIVTVAKNNYFGKGKWLCVAGAAIIFLTVPYTQFLLTQETETATFWRDEKRCERCGQIGFSEISIRRKGYGYETEI